MCRLCVYVIIHKHSLESFMCLDLVLEYYQSFHFQIFDHSIAERCQPQHYSSPPICRSCAYRMCARSAPVSSCFTLTPTGPGWPRRGLSGNCGASCWPSSTPSASCTACPCWCWSGCSCGPWRIVPAGCGSWPPTPSAAWLVSLWVLKTFAVSLVEVWLYVHRNCRFH